MEGPFAGPFGFGVYLSIDISEDMMTVACEIRALAEQRQERASPLLREARQRAVRLVADGVPSCALYYAAGKATDVAWVDYWKEVRRDFYPTQGLGPYRGFDAPLAPTLPRETVVDDVYAPLIADCPGDEVEVYDVAIAARLLELRRNEAIAVRESMDGSDSPWGRTRSRVDGGQLFSASVVSEVDGGPARADEDDTDVTRRLSAGLASLELHQAPSGADDLENAGSGPEREDVSDTSTVEASSLDRLGGEERAEAQPAVDVTDDGTDDMSSWMTEDDPYERHFLNVDGVRELARRTPRYSGSVETYTITETSATADSRGFEGSEGQDRSTVSEWSESDQTSDGPPRGRAASLHRMQLRRRR